MKLFIKLDDSHVCIDADEMREESCYIRAYNQGKLVATFLESDVSIAYLSERKGDTYGTKD